MKPNKKGTFLADNLGEILAVLFFFTIILIILWIFFKPELSGLADKLSFL